LINYLRLKYLSKIQIKIIFILILLTLLSAYLGLAVGSFNFSFIDLINSNLNQLEHEILFNIRLPRIVLCLIVGAALGIAGASLQGLFRNPLADPGLIGVSAGAAFGAVLSIVIVGNLTEASFFGIYLIPFSSIIGAFTVIFVIYFFSRGFRYDGVTYMLLLGIAINALAGVGIGILTFLSDNSQLRTLTFWMMGSFSNAEWQLVLPSILIIISSIVWIIPEARKIDLIQIGEIEASRLGINVKNLKIKIILSSAFIIGVSVSVSGILGFVGLVVPHLVRLIGGVNHTYLLIGSAFLGSCIVVLSDMISRIVIQPAELPIGLVTSAIGSPFFLWLILRVKKL